MLLSNKKVRTYIYALPPLYCVCRDRLCENEKGDLKMGLSNLFAWSKNSANSSCGAGEKPAETSAACGAPAKPDEAPAACGAPDKPAEAPAACGAPDKPTEAPAACGTGDK
ncbi:MAG: ACGX-repeat peptide [Christensenellales bacterium]